MKHLKPFSQQKRLLPLLCLAGLGGAPFAAAQNPASPAPPASPQTATPTGAQQGGAPTPSSAGSQNGSQTGSQTRSQTPSPQAPSAQTPATQTPAVAPPGQAATPSTSSPSTTTPGTTTPGITTPGARIGTPTSGLPAAPTVAPLGGGASSAIGAQGAPSASGGSMALTDSIRLAQTNQPAFTTAAAQAKIAQYDIKIAKAALLPQVVYHNQFLYTRGNGQQSNLPTFIANNLVHEYVSQGVVTETLGIVQYNAISRAAASYAIAQAELEIARRGLVAAVAGLYFSVSAADEKLQVAQRALGEAQNFTTLTQQREDAREVAHADVVKALLQQQQRQRDLEDAQLNAQKARLELGVVLFPDPRTQFTLASMMNTVPPLPSRAEIEAAAPDNPELKSSLAAFRGANLAVKAARAAYLPDLALNFAYGIDAPRFAIHSQQFDALTGNTTVTNNLGYAASATVDVPVFDWFQTHYRIKQSQALLDAAKITLTSTQRRLLAQLEEFYTEATVARNQLESLTLSVNTAAESLRLTRLRYSNGEATVLEVVDAQAALAAAENARVDGAIRYQAALANLQILTGTL